MLALPTSRDAERVAEALGAQSNGWAGTRASREEDGVGSSPLFAVAGVYDERNELLAGPTWTDLEIVNKPKSLTPIETRLLDLRTGVLARGGNRHSGLRSVRFVSIAAPHSLALRAELPCAWLDAEEGTSRHSHDETPAQLGTYVRETSSEAPREAISVGISEWSSSKNGRHFVERLASWSTGSDKAAVRSEALNNVCGLRDVGFETLLKDQRESWARKWTDAIVTIEAMRRLSWQRASRSSTCSPRRRTSRKPQWEPGASAAMRTRATYFGMPTYLSCPHFAPSRPSPHEPCLNTASVGFLRRALQLYACVGAGPDSRGSLPRAATTFLPQK